jgi:hypothetical protein
MDRRGLVREKFVYSERAAASINSAARQGPKCQSLAASM